VSTAAGDADHDGAYADMLPINDAEEEEEDEEDDDRARAPLNSDIPIPGLATPRRRREWTPPALVPGITIR
jgi:hypothetical protein